MSQVFCRCIMSQRSPIVLLRSSIVAAAAEGAPASRAGASAAGQFRRLHNTPARWQQGAAAAAGQEQEGWTGGDGSDGHRTGATRTLGIIFFSGLVGATACLGTWQAMRYSWKVDMIESRKQRMALEPANLPDQLEGAALAATMDALDQEADGKQVRGADGQIRGVSDEGKRLLENLEGRRVNVTGVFDHSKEVLVGPRGSPPGVNATSRPSLGMAPGQMGDFVHTPLRRSDGSVLLINRGWVPRSKGTNWSRPQGEVTLTAVLKTAEKRNTFSPDNKPETGQLLWAEKASLLQAAGLSKHGASESEFNSVPILLEAVGEEGDDSKVYPLTKKPKSFGDFYVTPQTHLMYSATWYALAAAGCALTYARFRRRGPAALKAKPPAS